MEGVHARLGQVPQVAGALAVHGEGGVGAAQPLRHRGVRRREVAHVELVDGPGGVTGHAGARGGGPLAGGQGVQAQVDGDGAPGVNGQGGRVGVGDHVGLHPPGGGYVDPYLPQVLRPCPDGAAPHLPAPVRAGLGTGPPGLALHQRDRAGGVAGLPRQQGDLLGGRGPQGQGGAGRRVRGTSPGRAQGGQAVTPSGGRVEVVQQGPDLDPGHPRRRTPGGGVRYRGRPRSR